MPLVKLAVRRLALGVITVWVVTVLVFLATEALPGNAAVAKLGRNATPAATAAFNSLYDLKRPIIVQYASWLGHVVTGHLGVSLITGQSVVSLIGGRLGYSLVLMCFAALVGLPLGLGIGVFAALRRDRWFDHGSAVLTLALAAVPEFIVGVALVVLLATNVFQILPAASLVDPSKSIFDQLNMIVLPGVTLALAITPYIARIIRASMIEVLESNYVAMARLKGLSERRVIWRHAFINAAGPTFQVIALCLAYLAGGVVVVETVFQYPGVGLALVTAVGNRDLPVIQALTLLLAAFYVVVTISADLATAAFSPRVRTALR
jgi:peptide/nickel transport system permease protein